MKSQYTIILTIIITLVTSMLLLAKIEDDQRTNNQDFWSIYFVDPFGDSNQFIIDNKSPETKTFTYDILVNSDTIGSGNIELNANEQKTIDNQNLQNQKNITIIVTTDTDSQKEIYKK